MVMLRALLRGSRVLGGANSLLFSTPKRLQTPSFSSQFHSFVSIKDMSLLSHSSLNLKAFQRFGISSSACPDPSGEENESDLMSDEDIIKLVEEIKEVMDAEAKDIEGAMYKVESFDKFLKGNYNFKSGAAEKCEANIAKLKMEISQLLNAKGLLLAEINKVIVTIENSQKHGIQQNFAEGTGKLVGIMGSTQVEGTASVHEQLELVRELVSNIKSKSEELRLQLELKLDEFQKQVDWLQQFRITSDDLDLDFWLTIDALCVIWLFMYGN